MSLTQNCTLEKIPIGVLMEEISRVDIENNVDIYLMSIPLEILLCKNQGTTQWHTISIYGILFVLLNACIS